MVDFPMAKDLHNAIICSIKNQQPNRAIPLFYTIAKKGIKMEYFKNEKFEKVHLCKEWNGFVNDYTTIRKKGMSNLDLERGNSVKQMFKEDQESAVKKDINHKQRPEFHSLVQKNEGLFIKWIQENGFPNENTIGIESPSENKIALLLTHFVQVGNLEGKSNEVILNYMEEAVMNGELSPYIYSYLVEIDKTSEIDLGTMAIIGVNNDHRAVRNFKAEELKLINSERSHYGLESIEDYHKKVLYVYRNKKVNSEFILYYLGSVNIYNLDEDLGEKIWENLMKDGKYKPLSN